MYWSPPTLVRRPFRFARGALWIMMSRLFVMGLAAGAAYGVVAGLLLGGGGGFIFGGYLGAIAGLTCGATSGALVAAAVWQQARRSGWDPLRQRALLGFLAMLPPLAGLGFIIWDERSQIIAYGLRSSASWLLLSLTPMVIAAACCWSVAGRVALWADNALRSA